MAKNLKVIVLIFISFFIGYLSRSITYKDSRQQQCEKTVEIGKVTVTESKKLNGEDTWNEINNHRISKGLNPLKIEPVICNNIVKRWRTIKDQNSTNDPHQGYEESRKGFEKAGFQVGEIFNSGSNAKEIVEGWVNSPSHKLWLENKDTVVGCAYAFDNFALLLSGYPNR